MCHIDSVCLAVGLADSVCHVDSMCLAGSVCRAGSMRLAGSVRRAQTQPVLQCLCWCLPAESSAPPFPSFFSP